jgi:hypothetical protein
MNDDRLLFALKRLGDEELSAASDRKIRARLETAWTVRALTMARRTLSVRRLVPVLAALVLFAGSAETVLGATADSPLWDTRVAIESAGALLRLSNEDRVAYLLDLVRSRTAEAARQQAAGHPDAAAKARAAASSALVQLGGDPPKIEVNNPVASASATPSAANSPSPSASPSASGVPAVQLPPPASPTPTHTVAPTPVRTPTPTLVRTEPPVTATPTPSAVASKQPVTITGTVHDAAGANALNVCISTSPTAPTSSTACSVRTTTNGTYTINASVTPGASYTITLYAYYTDPATGALYGGSATATMTAPTTLMPLISLTPRR